MDWLITNGLAQTLVDSVSEENQDTISEHCQYLNDQERKNVEPDYDEVFRQQIVRVTNDKQIVIRNSVITAIILSSGYINMDPDDCIRALEEIPKSRYIFFNRISNTGLSKIMFSEHRNPRLDEVSKIAYSYVLRYASISMLSEILDVAHDLAVSGETMSLDRFLTVFKMIQGEQKNLPIDWIFTIAN